MSMWGIGKEWLSQSPQWMLDIFLAGSQVISPQRLKFGLEFASTSFSCHAVPSFPNFPLQDPASTRTANHHFHFTQSLPDLFIPQSLRGSLIKITSEGFQFQFSCILFDIHCNWLTLNWNSVLLHCLYTSVLFNGSNRSIIFRQVRKRNYCNWT